MKYLFISLSALLIYGCSASRIIEFPTGNGFIEIPNTLEIESFSGSKISYYWNIKYEGDVYKDLYLESISFATKELYEQYEKHCLSVALLDYPYNYCDYNSNVESFSAEKSALEKRQRTFVKKSIHPRYKDEIWQLNKINNTYFYTFNENYIGDCGQQRHYSTFVGNENIEFTMNKGSINGCELNPDTEVDTYFENLGITVQEK